MRKKVLFISEYLNPPYDEGIKKTVYNLFLELDKNFELQVICRYGFDKKNIHVVHTNPLYFSNEIKKLIKNFGPDSIIYLPFQSSTFASYLRLIILFLFSKGSEIIFIALQPKPLKKWQQFLAKYIKPSIALTPSPSLRKLWDDMKINNEIIPLLTDLSVFKPLSKHDSRDSLRKKYSLPLDSFIVSHMGHLNEGRNLKTLIPIQKAGIQVLIVSSSSTPKDAHGHESLKNELLQSGIILLDNYIEHIEEIYQLSDIYIFPVVKENSSIGMPLSVLEARACGTPVITTDYGSLQFFLGDDFGGIYYTDPDDFLRSVTFIRNIKIKNFVNTKVSDLNDKFYKIIYNQIEE